MASVNREEVVATVQRNRANQLHQEATNHEVAARQYELIAAAMPGRQDVTVTAIQTRATAERRRAQVGEMLTRAGLSQIELNNLREDMETRLVNAEIQVFEAEERRAAPHLYDLSGEQSEFGYQAAIAYKKALEEWFSANATEETPPSQ